jgi:hypothetical protein
MRGCAGNFFSVGSVMFCALPVMEIIDAKNNESSKTFLMRKTGLGIEHILS